MAAKDEDSLDLLRYVEYELHWFLGAVEGLVVDQEHIYASAKKRYAVTRANIKELRKRFERGDGHE